MPPKKRYIEYYCMHCDYFTHLKSDYTKHCSTKKHNRKSKYECKECNYITFKKANYSRHLSSNKHKKKQNNTTRRNRK